MKTVGIIPARYGSTRLPAKPLALINGKPMIQHVYEQCSKAALLEKVVVATDDERIKAVVEAFNGEVIMTSPNHLSGTDRVAEASEYFDAEIVVNIQGDEPLIHPDMIDSAIRPLLEDENIQMGSLKNILQNEADIQNPNIVKVVTDSRDFALYFSRSPIPFVRNQDARLTFYKHLGIYVFRKSTLLRLTKLPSAMLEITESLEQLRALYNGIQIVVPTTSYDSIGVDTREDLEKIEMLLKGETVQ